MGVCFMLARSLMWIVNGCVLCIRDKDPFQDHSTFLFHSYCSHTNFPLTLVSQGVPFDAINLDAIVQSKVT
jgi:hypothetical protein